jgi:geranylgeranyl diphosphate synthase type II
MNLQEIMEKYSEITNNRLDEIINIKDSPEKIIYESMKYSILSGGKRLRPSLLYATYNLFMEDMTYTIDFACALEMIHTFSLIHDDLPCIDNDDYRRGKLSNHKVYGEAMAVLAGDALLNKAYEIMIDDIIISRYSQDKITALKEISGACGTNGMLTGEVVDILSEGKHINLETLKYMHKNKTGALIKAAARVGAILGGASDEQLSVITEYAESIGLAFQIKDDILSEIGDETKLGKTVGNDKLRGKSTYVTVLGLEQSQKLLDESVTNVITSINKLDNDIEFHKQLAIFIKDREK